MVNTRKTWHVGTDIARILRFGGESPMSSWLANCSYLKVISYSTLLYLLAFNSRECDHTLQSSSQRFIKSVIFKRINRKSSQDERPKQNLFNVKGMVAVITGGGKQAYNKISSMSN
jgi:hypothetical protein